MRGPLQVTVERIFQSLVFGTVVAVSGAAAIYCYTQGATLFTAFFMIGVSAGVMAIRRELGEE